MAKSPKGQKHIVNDIMYHSPTAIFGETLQTTIFQKKKFLFHSELISLRMRAVISRQVFTLMREVVGGTRLNTQRITWFLRFRRRQFYISLGLIFILTIR